MSQESSETADVWRPLLCCPIQTANTAPARRTISSGLYARAPSLFTTNMVGIPPHGHQSFPGDFFVQKQVSEIFRLARFHGQNVNCPWVRRRSPVIRET